MKISILDEGYWSPELFRGYQAMASMSEKGFGGPGKYWGALWAKGKGQTSPLRGGAPPTPFPTLLGGLGRLHLAWEAILHLLGLGGMSP